ncbi:RagB/SusD family nutrient uptake outer membrane protein [Ekhidna sp. To15]|uniref:RagB/SusD family nutrient uptake outer membrane protein n=1 Tax=Ekhidna sp. To15 TaxID=3395267 RepID=UPI003F52850D
MDTIKITNRKFFVLLISVLLIGCDDILEIDAENSLSGDIYISDQNFEDALNGAYVNLGGIYDGGDGGELYGGDFQIIGTLLARNKNSIFFWRASEAPNYQDFMDKDILSINTRVEANWRRAYETINIVNGILANIDRVDNNTLKDRIQGEALAIRGILYFELARFWGPQYQAGNTNQPAVPILLDQIMDANDIPDLDRSSVAEVYARAIDDLESAEQLLGVFEGRIDNNVCRAMLARIAMQQNDFSTALVYLNQLIPNYTLNTNVMDAFNNTNVSSEDVFVIQQNSVSSTGSIATRSGLVAHLASLTGVGFAALNINHDILDSDFGTGPGFYAADDRYSLQEDLNINSSIQDINGNAAYYNDVINTTAVSTAKYYRTDANIPVIRLAELLLSRAEATLEDGGFVSPVTGSALNDLNAVRTRSGLTALVDTLSADAFYDSLVIERNRELIYEGVFFHDLKRWAVTGRTGFNISGLNPLDDALILPIPQSECDASPGLCN